MNKQKQVRTYLLLLLLVLLTGCTAWGFVPVTSSTPTPPAATLTSSPTRQPTNTARPEGAAARILPIPTQPARCIVSTGYSGGTVNVRSGPGMTYQVVDVAQEGQELPLFGQPVNGWQRVTTLALVDGWFYVSTWCKDQAQ